MARPKTIKPGPGRKALPEGQRKVLRRIFIKPETDSKLAAVRQGDEPLGHTIDRLVEQIRH